MQPALHRHRFEKARNTLVFYRAQTFGEGRLVRIERFFPDGREAVAGDNFERPIGIFESIDGDFDALAVFLMREVPQRLSGRLIARGWGTTRAAKTSAMLIGNPDANFTFVVFRERAGCDAGPMIPIWSCPLHAHGKRRTRCPKVNSKEIKRRRNRRLTTITRKRAIRPLISDHSEKNTLLMRCSKERANVQSVSSIQ
jgi:hypothetical protein